METLHQEIQRTHFRYLNNEAIKAPILFIKEFCSTETEIELFRQDIAAIIHAAGTDKRNHNGKFYKNADEYVFNQRKIITLIEALWTLYHQAKPNLSIQPSHYLYQNTKWERDGIDIAARLNSTAKHYRKLDNREVNDVRYFLCEFFMFSDITAWRETLDEILLYAHMDESIADGSSYFSHELIPIAEYLEKMVEAVFLIAELTPTNTKTTKAKDTDHRKIVISSTTEGTTSTPSSNNTASTPSLDDDNFTDSLIKYLCEFWSHLETENINCDHNPLLLSEALEKKLLLYFESFHPKFLSRNFRRVYMGYLEHIFEIDTPYYYNELRIFTAQMDTFFELLDLADKETKHWPQENRLGFEEV